MITSTHGAALTDEDVERRLRWANVDCVDPESVDQGDLLAFSEGPVLADIAHSLQAHLAVCEYCSALSVEYRRIAGERRRRRSFLQAAGAASIAAGIVAAILFHSGQSDLRTIREYEVAVLRGTIARTMAVPPKTEVPEEPWHFAPTSPIELVLRPRVEDALGVTPSAAVYQGSRGGALSRVSDVRIDLGTDEGYPLLSISATGEKVFGASSGERTLIVVLAPDAAALELLDGKTTEEVKASLPDNTQVFDFDVVYEN